MNTLKILMVGDISGKPGMLAVKKTLHRLIGQHSIDFVVVNGENTAGGVGITGELAKELFSHEVDCITTGNHIWRQREIRSYIENEPRLLRPHNFSDKQPGTGIGLYETAAGQKVGVLNLSGRVFMDPADNPFDAADKALSILKDANIILVDFHAEATSEKKAMVLHLTGRVTAVIGTHTHVQTADEQIIEPGTAFLTDVGMTGPHDSVIGMRKDVVLERFTTGMPGAFKLAKKGVRFQAVIIETETGTGRAVSIERIDMALPD